MKQIRNQEVKQGAEPLSLIESWYQSKIKRRPNPTKISKDSETQGKVGKLKDPTTAQPFGFEPHKKFDFKILYYFQL